MSRFNQSTIKKSTPNTTNMAGGQAYSQSAKLELASLVLTSFGKDTYYEKASDRFVRLNDLIMKVDPQFAAKCLLFARNEYGMRSITHAGAGMLASRASGTEWGKKFYDLIVRRPDDMTEIASVYWAINGDVMLSNSIRRGFQSAFGRFNDYQLAKYRMEGKAIKLVDIVNLVRPIPTINNKEALKGLVDNTLKSTETWEAQMTKAGQMSENETDLANAKADVWKGLLEENKLPYFALLRNLRNIMQQAPDCVTLACDKLVNEAAIKKSLVLPFRFTTAFVEIEKLGSSKQAREVQVALSKAVDISLSNLPKFEGENCVVLDTSGSMNGQPKQIGSLFAACLTKAINADCIVFGNQANYVNVSLADSTMTIAQFLEKQYGGGTDYRSWVNLLNKKYDRIIVLSDGEAWGGYRVAETHMKEYRRKFAADPHVFNFDLAGNGTMQFPEHKTYCLAGFSEKTLDLIKILEEDKNALISKIEQIKLT